MSGLYIGHRHPVHGFGPAARRARIPTEERLEVRSRSRVAGYIVPRPARWPSSRAAWAACAARVLLLPAERDRAGAEGVACAYHRRRVQAR